MLPVSILGGYLGAGKTTLVNHLLRHADGLRIAVLVNEFGALPIDADLIEAQDDTLISIAGGCVCCSYGNDLIQAMVDLSKMEIAPDHVLIESSGVALPGAIAASISLIEDMVVEGVIVMCDAETIRDQLANEYIGDTIERQLADADLVLLNKADLLSETELDAVAGWLKTQVPGAEVVPAQMAQVPRDVVLQRFDADPKRLMDRREGHLVPFSSKVIQFNSDCDADAVAQQLADPDLALIRAKGFVPTAQGLRAIQVVGRRWSVSVAPAQAKPGVVVISQSGDVSLEHIQALFWRPP